MASVGQPWAPLDGKRWVTTFRLPRGHLTWNLPTLLPLLQASVPVCGQGGPPLRSRRPVITAPTAPPSVGTRCEYPPATVPCTRPPVCSEPHNTHTAPVSGWETPRQGPLLVPQLRFVKTSTNVNSPPSYVHLHVYVHTYIKRTRCAGPEIQSRRARLIKTASQGAAKLKETSGRGRPKLWVTGG